MLSKNVNPPNRKRTYDGESMKISEKQLLKMMYFLDLYIIDIELSNDTKEKLRQLLAEIIEQQSEELREIEC